MSPQVKESVTPHIRAPHRERESEILKTTVNDFFTST